MSFEGVPEGTVTVLFTDLVESTRLNQQLGDDEARAVGRRVEAMARGLVEEHRGVLIKEMGDGLMAAFTSARRAVRAAQEIQGEMRRMQRDGLEDGVQMRIGLHTGEVIAEDGDLHGESVIIAKRIEGIAPAGGILASDTVHGVLGTARDELVDQGTAQLKGIDDEWRLYLVPVPDDDRRVGLGDSEPTPYVGRSVERAALAAVVEEAAGGRGVMVLISGEAGVGKSRLTREVADIATAAGFGVLTGNCVDMESPPPYQPTIDHIEQATRATSAEQLRTVLGENAPEVAKLMPSLRQRYDDIPAAPELSPDQERRYMLHGVGEFIERAARNQPLMLVFEDVHWADESTLLLLRHVAPRLADVPLLVVATYRPDELTPDRPLTTALGPLVRDLGAREVRLELLGPAEVAEVLRARAGQPPPDDLVDLVMAETQGNPFFVEEIYRHLRDAGRLFADDGTWRGGFEIGDTEVPQGVRLVIGRRLDALDPEHRKLLATAAAFGRSFRFTLLAAATSADEDDLFDALEAGMRAHLVEEVPSDGDATYVFVHEQFRQTLLGELSTPRRQRIHVRIADALADDTSDGAVVERAHHLHQAGSASPAARTVDALLAAAEATLASLAFEDARRHLARAEPLVTDRQRIDLAALRARALRGSGRVDDALDVLGVELARDDGLDRTALRLQRVDLLLDQFRGAEALGDLDRLAALAAEDGDADLAVGVMLARGRAHYILSLDDPAHAEPSRDAYQAAYDAAAEAGDPAKMARALLPTVWFNDYWPEYLPIARDNADEALRLALEVGDEDLIIDARIAVAKVAGPRGGLEAGDLLLDLLEDRRDPVKLNAHCFWMMWQYLGAGQFAESVAMCDRGMELADLLGTPPVQYGSIKAMALVHLGRFDEVEAAIAQEVTDDAHPFGQAMAATARGSWLVAMGAWGPAAEVLIDAWERAVAVNRAWMQAAVADQLTLVAPHLGDDPGALARIAEIADRTRAVLPTASAATRASVALAEGRPAEAIAALAAEDAGERGTHTAAMRRLVLLAEAQLAAGDAEVAAITADEAVAATEAASFGAISWRGHMVRALALEQMGDGAAAAAARATATERFEALAARIAEDDLRRWFRAQDLAPA